MTMAYHIYDSVYCKVMTIVVYDMQSKDMEAHCIWWRKLNAIIFKKRLGMPIFKGFMANSAQANKNVILVIDGIGDPIIKIFFFYKTQFLNKHQVIDHTIVP